MQRTPSGYKPDAQYYRSLDAFPIPGQEFNVLELWVPLVGRPCHLLGSSAMAHLLILVLMANVTQLLTTSQGHATMNQIALIPWETTPEMQDLLGQDH